MSGRAADRLSVIIPTRDRWPIARRTLDALSAQTATGFEVVVVVDGEDQDVPVDLPCDLVIQKPHGGPGAARNAGVAEASGEIVLFLGDDMVPAPDLISRHLDAHAEQPDETTAVLGHVDWHPDVADSRILRWLDWSGTQFDYVNLADQAGQDVGFGRFYSCNVSLHRSLYQRVGGFDEDFIFYYEDLDAGWRLHEAGMRLIYEPRAGVRHLHDYNMGGIKRRFAGIALGERMMAAKHDWFEPFYRRRVVRAAQESPVSKVWPRVADLIPAGTPYVGPRVRRRANRWYLQQVAGGFLDSWERAREVVELAAYLGDDFDSGLLSRANDEVNREAAEADDEIDFYRTSTSYLYDLTVFAMSGTKDPYHEVLREHAPVGASLLDYGCGIGADGLKLLDEGYQVTFADFDNPSTRYLRWRLDHRGQRAGIIDIEKDHLPTGFDVTYSFDVLEHVPDPFEFLARLEKVASLVIVNLLEDDEHHHEHDLHYELPIDDLLDHAQARGLVSYTRWHDDRSHLVVYRGTSES